MHGSMVQCIESQVKIVLSSCGMLHQPWPQIEAQRQCMQRCHSDSFKEAHNAVDDSWVAGGTCQ